MTPCWRPRLAPTTSCSGNRMQSGHRPAFDAVSERVAWWAEVFEVPCVGFAGALDEVAPLAAAGAEFIALGDWVFGSGRVAGRGGAASRGCGDGRMSALRPALAALVAAGLTAGLIAAGRRPGTGPAIAARPRHGRKARSKTCSEAAAQARSARKRRRSRPRRQSHPRHRSRHGASPTWRLERFSAASISRPLRSRPAGSRKSATSRR